MSDIITERSNGILRVELNRPERKNALTAAMYTRLADIFNEAAEDQETVSSSGTAPETPSPPATTSGIFSRIRPGRANLRRSA